MPLRLRRTSSSVTVNPPVIKKQAMDVAQRPGNEFTFKNEKHASSVLSCFNQLRAENAFTDVILSADGREFPCHRAVLVAESKYFRAMFCNDHRESREMLVQINGMGGRIMELLLGYLYTSTVTITAANVQLLLEASNLFQIHPLTEACSRFLEAQLDPCNCIRMRDFAEAHSLADLHRKASAMITERFSDVTRHEEFMELPKHRVVEYIMDDAINVPREEVVYEAVKRWIQHDIESRSRELAEILSYVRLPLIHPSYFMNDIECDEMIAGNPDCQQILLETRKYHILGTVNESNSARTRPRRSTGCVEAVVIVGGCDRDGGYNMPYVEAYDAVAQTWTQLAKIPAYTKAEYAVTSFGNSIILSGGKIHAKDVWLYQSHLNSWVRGASLCKGRRQHRMAALGGHVYCVGGYDGKSKQASVERYDSFSNSWQELSPMPTAVSSCAMAACNGKIYVVGGENNESRATDKVQCYDPDTDQWTYKAPIPAPQRCAVGASLDNLIYVVGGKSKVMYCYDPLTDGWAEAARTKEPLDDCGVTACGGKIYITGGTKEGTVDAQDAVLCYQPKAGVITRVTSLPRAVSCHGCVTIHRFHQQAQR